MRSAVLCSWMVLATGLLSVPGSARAHVKLQPTKVAQAEVTRVKLEVENERDAARTIKVDLKVPRGLELVSAPRVRAWRVRTVDEPLEPALRLPGGRRLARRASRIILTTSSNSAAISGHRVRRFPLFFVTLRRPGSVLSLKVLQGYDNGEIVRWIGPPDAEEPAPRLRVVEASGSARATVVETEPEPTRPSTQPDSGDNDDAWNGPVTVVAGLGMVVLGAGSLIFLIRRRRSRPGSARRR